LATVEVDPASLRIETFENSVNGTWAKLEIDTSVAAEKLLAGIKLNLVLIGKTESGW
jgi:hypothetical protein